MTETEYKRWKQFSLRMAHRSVPDEAQVWL